MRRKKRTTKKHKRVILKGFVANVKVNKVFECEGYNLFTNNRGGMIDMAPRVDSLYYKFYGWPIELVMRELPDEIARLDDGLSVLSILR